jgi:hypothetical protein
MSGSAMDKTPVLKIKKISSCIFSYSYFIVLYSQVDGLYHSFLYVHTYH